MPQFRQAVLHNVGSLNNTLLDMLPVILFRRLLQSMSLVSLSQGEVVHEPDQQLQHVYFPTTSIVSLNYMMNNGGSPELAVVGNEGMIGVQAILGGLSMPNSAIVQRSGLAYRLNRDIFLQEFERTGGRRCGALQKVLLRYAQALFTQLAQFTVCNSHHSVHRRLSRWILMGVDRTLNNELTVTHDQIAGQLGVRREGVTAALGKLHGSGLLQCSRGQIAVLDRVGLEGEACECYQVIKSEYDRLLTAFPAQLHRSNVSPLIHSAGIGLAA